jgi:predicted TPR repeat methyltransferase
MTLQPPRVDPKIHPNVHLLWAQIKSKYPIFQKVIAARLDDFSESWLQRFEREMSAYFDCDAEAIERAANAYCSFSLEAMRLQAKFDLTHTYAQSSYDDALADIYTNTEYMVNTYLPALLLSHYLWPHHYRQLHWAHEHFIEPLRDIESVRFCDVGIGTGFYSKELLCHLDNAVGWGFDVSEAAIAHTKQILTKWRVHDRYQLCQMEVENQGDRRFNAFVSVELLEHLEDPQGFLCQLRGVVEDGALGFVTAAIDAPNRDHIYLYRSCEAVAEQLQKAGFEVVHAENFAAYETASPQETVPQSGCFVVRAVSPA